MKNFSKAISWLFHPLLIPTLAVVLILSANPYHYAHLTDRNFYLYIMATFFLTFGFPVIWLFMLKNLNLVESIHLKTSKDRIIPYIGTATFYLWTWKMFQPSSQGLIFSDTFIATMILGATIAIFICFFINLFSKISLHTAGMGSFIAVVLILVHYSVYDLRMLIPLILVIAGMVGTARLWLKEHSFSEVMYGYSVGFISQFIAFFIIPIFFN